MTEQRADYLTRFKPVGAEPLADKPVSVFLPKDLDQYVRMKPNRAEWLRQAIAAAVQRELMQEPEALNSAASSLDEVRVQSQINKAL